MSGVRIALANVRLPDSPEDAVEVVTEAIGEAASRGAHVVCFPECIVPGYRIGARVPPHDETLLEGAWGAIDAAAARHGVAVVLGTERRVDDGLRITARVTSADGSLLGFQDKVQLDPSEEGTYRPGAGRRIFEAAGLRFGVVICHEGWRYPETVRWAARQGAHVVFHPHFEVVEGARAAFVSFADPRNTFHEKAALCRAAENTIWFATVNCALPGAATTSAVVRPDGTLLAHQPYGQAGVLVAAIETDDATGRLAARYRPLP